MTVKKLSKEIKFHLVNLVYKQKHLLELQQDKLKQLGLQLPEEWVVKVKLSSESSLTYH